MWQDRALQDLLTEDALDWSPQFCSWNPQALGCPAPDLTVITSGIALSKSYGVKVSWHCASYSVTALYFRPLAFVMGISGIP